MAVYIPPGSVGSGPMGMPGGHAANAAATARARAISQNQRMPAFYNHSGDLARAAFVLGKQ